MKITKRKIFGIIVLIALSIVVSNNLYEFSKAMLSGDIIMYLSVLISVTGVIYNSKIMKEFR